ncbi:MAG TPA: hypothetical protein VGE84_07970 [Allosphingosinicella sp.]
MREIDEFKLDFTEIEMNKILTAVAMSIALPAAGYAQTPAKPAQPQAQTCPDHSKKAGTDQKMDHSKMAGMDMSGMDHSKMAGMDHSKMMGSCTTPPMAGSTSQLQGHRGH